VVARKLKGRLQTAEVNVDQHPELAAQYAITQVPTLILYDHATPIERLSGVMSPQELSVHLRGVLADYAEPVAQGRPVPRARPFNARPIPAR
jgi:thioredoxin-like negative regulator of GroEL